MRRAVVRRLGAVVIVAAACAAGCGAVTKPLPANTLTVFDVQKISGVNYTGAGESAMSGGGIRFHINSSVVSGVLVETGCGGGGTSGFQLTADHLVVGEFVNGIDPAKCTPEQFAAVDRVRELMSSSPRYRFDGKELQLIGEKTTVTLTLVESRSVEIDSEGHMHLGTRSGG